MEPITFVDALGALLQISTQRKELMEELTRNTPVKPGPFKSMFEALPTDLAKQWAYKLVHGTFYHDPTPIIQAMVPD